MSINYSSIILTVHGHLGFAGLAEEPGEVAVDEKGQRIEDNHHDDGYGYLHQDVVVEDIGANELGHQHLDDADEIVLQRKIGNTGDGDITCDA